MENEQEKKQRSTTHRKPVREADHSLIEGQKPIPVRPQDATSKYSGGLLKPGEGEHFEREQTRMNRYSGISARPGSSADLEEKLYGAQSAQSQPKVKTKSGCLGLILLAAAVPLIAIMLVWLR